MNYFFVGGKFSSFDEIQAVMQQYKRDLKVEFYIDSSRRIMINKLKRAAVANRALIYQDLKLSCSRGGRIYNSRGRGLRNRKSWKTGCRVFVSFRLSKCAQYLQVMKMCLDHNHELTSRPPSRLEKRAERRRQNIMKCMKVSYEDAVIFERLKVSAKDGLVGPVEIENSDSFNSFESQAVDVASDSELKQTACSTSENMAKKTKGGNQTEAPSKDSEEYLISDDDDYIRPLIIPTKMQPQKDKDDDISALEQNHFTSKEDNDVPTLEQNIFTRKGDDGMASTFSGMRLYKDDIVFEALGTIEELSSSIGHAKEFLPKNCTDISAQLVEIQCVLQDMVIHVGTPQSNCSEFQKVNSQFPESHVIHLENLIKLHEKRLPKVNRIILPSGGPCSTGLHVARTICRRAERKVVCIVREGDADKTVTCYLNRLGDYLFVAARIASFFSGIQECVYTKPNFVVKPNMSVNIVKPTMPVSIVKPTVPVNSTANQSYSIIYIPQPMQLNPTIENLFSNG